MTPLHGKSEYQIGIVCALPLERTAVEAVLDRDHDSQSGDQGDNNVYSFGSIGEHNIVAASLGAGDYGTVSAAGVVTDMLRSFPSIKFGLMVGIAGGMPRPDVKGGDVRLGDVVVGCVNGVPSVINYRLGKETSLGFDIRSELGEPSQVIQRAVSALQAQHKRRGPTYLVHLQDMFRNNPRLDRVRIAENYYNLPEAPDYLFKADSSHLPHATECEVCRESGESTITRAPRLLSDPPDDVRNAKFVKFRADVYADYPIVHYGTVASADTLMKNAEMRDKVFREVKRQRKAKILCFEMEAAGIVKGWPCLVIRGICDYADSHKNDLWQNFAAATAAAYAKDLLLRIPAEKIPFEPRVDEIVNVDAPMRSKRMQGAPPTSTVPFLRDPDFVDRAELDVVHRTLSSTRARAALVGLGGVGKTQLAIEYCYRLRERSPDTWVLWLHASNAARFDDSIRQLADDVKIPKRKNAKSNIFQLVYDWLHDARNGKWLLVLDNTDDVSFLLESPDMSNSGKSYEEKNANKVKTRLQYLPVCEHGSVIVTSRYQAAASRLVDDCDTIPVLPMGREHALALLEKKMACKDDTITAEKLVAAFEYMPLAIAQAAAYMRKRAPPYSVAEYLARLEKSDKSKTKILTQEISEKRRDEEAKNSIILTWQISFEYIHQSRRSAADLLSLMSFFNYQGIPKILLRVGSLAVRVPANETSNAPDQAADALDNEVSGDSAEDEFGEDICMLRDFHFLSVSENGSTFGMHRLVQLAARKWLDENGQSQPCEEQSIRNLDLALPRFSHENRGTCQVLYPHAKLVHGLEPKGSEARLRCASVLAKAAEFANELGHWADAEAMARESRRIRVELLGHECGPTFRSEHILAGALDCRQKHEEAEQIIRRTLVGREKMLGKDHGDTLTSVVSLGVNLVLQGKYDAADEMLQRALEGAEKAYGENHSHTLTIIDNLSAVLSKKEKYEEAKNLIRLALEGRERLFGKDHPQTLNSYYNLAGVLYRNGEVDASETIHRRTLEDREKVLGKYHVDTLRSTYFLAYTLAQQGRFDEAFPLYTRAMGSLRKTLGEEHFLTVQCREYYSQAIRASYKDPATSKDELEGDAATQTEGMENAPTSQTEPVRKITNTSTEDIDNIQASKTEGT